MLFFPNIRVIRCVWTAYEYGNCYYANKYENANGRTVYGLNVNGYGKIWFSGCIFICLIKSVVRFLNGTRLPVVNGDVANTVCICRSIQIRYTRRRNGKRRNQTTLSSEIEIGEFDGDGDGWSRVFKKEKKQTWPRISLKTKYQYYICTLADQM